MTSGFEALALAELHWAWGFPPGTLSVSFVRWEKKSKRFVRLEPKKDGLNISNFSDGPELDTDNYSTDPDAVYVEVSTTTAWEGIAKQLNLFDIIIEPAHGGPTTGIVVATTNLGREKEKDYTNKQYSGPIQFVKQYSRRDLDSRYYQIKASLDDKVFIMEDPVFGAGQLYSEWYRVGRESPQNNDFPIQFRHDKRKIQIRLLRYAKVERFEIVPDALKDTKALVVLDTKPGILPLPKGSIQILPDGVVGDIYVTYSRFERQKLKIDGKESLVIRFTLENEVKRKLNKADGPKACVPTTEFAVSETQLTSALRDTLAHYSVATIDIVWTLSAGEKGLPLPPPPYAIESAILPAEDKLDKIVLKKPRFSWVKPLADKKVDNKIIDFHILDLPSGLLEDNTSVDTHVLGVTFIRTMNKTGESKYQDFIAIRGDMASREDANDHGLLSCLLGHELMHAILDSAHRSKSSDDADTSDSPRCLFYPYASSSNDLIGPFAECDPSKFPGITGWDDTKLLRDNIGRYT